MQLLTGPAKACFRVVGPTVRHNGGQLTGIAVFANTEDRRRCCSRTMKSKNLDVVDLQRDAPWAESEQCLPSRRFCGSPLASLRSSEHGQESNTDPLQQEKRIKKRIAFRMGVVSACLSSLGGGRNLGGTVPAITKRREAPTPVGTTKKEDGGTRGS